MRPLFFLLAMTFGLLSCAHAQPPPRTVFVQLFEWPWADVARECEIYLGPNGFSAVQVTPPHEHVSRSQANWWERYQVVSYQLKSRSGDEAGFANMVQRCHQAGVAIYVDTVLNHMTGFISGVGFAGTNFTHFGYPGIYTDDDFHHCGRNGNDIIKNFQDLYELQNCALVDLADLKTESEHVRATLAAYMNHLLDLGVDGFRLDAAKHIPTNDIHNILSRLKRSSYVYQELIIGSGDPVTYNDYAQNGDVMDYGYPFNLGTAFKNNQAGNLQNIAQGQPASANAIVFVTNHDLERAVDRSMLLTVQDNQPLYRLAQIFMLTWPYGYPHLFSGFAFSDRDAGPPMDAKLMTTSPLDAQGNCVSPWICAHRFSEIPALVDFRNRTNSYFTATDLWTNGSNQIAFGRGKKGFVIVNYSGGNLTQTFKTSLPAGTYCNLIESDYNVQRHSCPKGYQIDSNGNLNVTLSPMSALVILQQAKATK